MMPMASGLLHKDVVGSFVVSNCLEYSCTKPGRISGVRYDAFICGHDFFICVKECIHLHDVTSANIQSFRHEWVVLHVWISHVTYEWVMLCMNESCHKYWRCKNTFLQTEFPPPACCRSIFRKHRMSASNWPSSVTDTIKSRHAFSIFRGNSLAWLSFYRNAGDNSYLWPPSVAH